jgi:hypothetical protein
VTQESPAEVSNLDPNVVGPRTIQWRRAAFLAFWVNAALVAPMVAAAAVVALVQFSVLMLIFKRTWH